MANSAQLVHSQETLLRFVKEAKIAFRAASKQIYLLGFGQGAVIVLSLMLTAPEDLGGAIAISGMVPPEVQSRAAPPDRLRGLSVLLLHGRSDGTYPVAHGRATSAMLSMLPVVLTYREISMGHFLSQECLAEVSSWLTARLDKAGIVGMPDPPEYSVRLGGVTLKVRNLERAIAFYLRFLGMRLVERTGKAYAFLTNDHTHHVIALQNAGAEAPAALAEATGVHRVRFEVLDRKSFAQAYQRLKGAGIAVKTLDRTVRWAMYFDDPDGNNLEIYWDARQLPGRPMQWQGRDLPLEEARILEALENPKG
jgi:catechol 2,3-dioxygenase-like lactoylglutathione lyase family enzyme